MAQAARPTGRGLRAREPRTRDHRDFAAGARARRSGAAVQAAHRSDVPVLTNLFGTEQRIAAAIGGDAQPAFQALGQLLAALRSPSRRAASASSGSKLPLLREALKMAPKTCARGPCQEVVVEGAAVDLAAWPIQTCWPERCRTADHVGPDHDPRPGTSGRISASTASRSSAAIASSCAGSRTAAARPISRPGARASRATVSGLRQHRRRPGDDARGRHADSEHAVGICVRRSAARRAHAARQVPRIRAARAGQCRDHARRPHRAGRHALPRARSATTRVTTTRSRAFRS